MVWLTCTVLVCASIFGSVKADNNRGWPPSSLDLLRDPLTGAYDVSINPHLAPTAYTTNSMCEYASHYEKQYGKTKAGDCFQRAVHALGNTNGAAFDMYPQPVSHFDILKQVRAGEPVSEVPINDPRRRILTTPKTCEKRRDIVIMIESCVACTDGRKNSRNTFLNRKLWSNVNIGWVFTTGVPAREPIKTFYLQGMNMTMEAYKPGTNIEAQLTQLLAEAKEHGDILVGDYEEDGYHHVWTYIVSLRWASVFCNKKVPIFAYMQSGKSLVPRGIVNHLNTLKANDKPRYFGGLVYHGLPVNHDTKNPWGTSWEEMPWVGYPPLVDGMLTILGHDTVQEAAILSAFTRYSRILSFYITVVNRKLRIHPKHINGMYHSMTQKKQALNAIVAPTPDTDNLINWGTGKAK